MFKGSVVYSSRDKEIRLSCRQTSQFLLQGNYGEMLVGQAFRERGSPLFCSFLFYICSTNGRQSLGNTVDISVFFSAATMPVTRRQKKMLRQLCVLKFRFTYASHFPVSPQIPLKSTLAGALRRSA